MSTDVTASSREESATVDAAAPAPIQREVVEETVKRTIAKALDLDPEQVQLSCSLQLDFDAQSLDMLDISFALEREFKVPFPQSDLIQRAGGYFDEELLVDRGRITDFGLELLRKGMPEADESKIVPGLKAADVVGLITVDTFVRLVLRLLEAKQELPRECAGCGARMQESGVMPEFVCPECGEIRPLPSGDEVLLKDIVALVEGATSR